MSNLYTEKRQDKKDKGIGLSYYGAKDRGGIPTGDRRFCKNHPTASWGRNPYTGEWFKRCIQGNMKNEACEIGG